MKLVGKLLNYVHEAFRKDADVFTALRVRHTSDAFSWHISDRVLSLRDGANPIYDSNTGFPVPDINLSGLSILDLSVHLGSIGGVTVAYVDTERQGLSACSLIDGDGYQNRSNGDIISGYQSSLWMYLDALSTELAEAKKRITDMLDQMSIATADDEWLDEWGGYFGIPRDPGEIDAVYANRIIIEVIKPRGNNKAIEAALYRKYGQIASVTDYYLPGIPIPSYVGRQYNDGTYVHNQIGSEPVCGLFQITIGYDILLSGAPPAFISDVRAFVEKLRDAGTHLDSVALTSSGIDDTFYFTPVDDGVSLMISDVRHYNSLYSHIGTILHDSTVTSETL